MLDDGDGCATEEEMNKLFSWGSQDADKYADMVTGFFEKGDANADGLMTWAELEAWLDTADGQEVFGGAKMQGEEEKDAMKAFFKYFDNNHGDGDFALTEEEALAGVQKIAKRVSSTDTGVSFVEESKFIWAFLNEDAD